MGVHRKDELIAKTEGGGMPEPPEPRRRQREPRPGEPPQPARPRWEEAQGDGKEPDRRDDQETTAAACRSAFRASLAKKENMPEIVKQHYEKGDPGTINHFFNRPEPGAACGKVLARRRFLRASRPVGVSGWCDGRRSESSRSRIDTAVGKTSCRPAITEMKVSEGLADNQNPPGSGGMLSTLWLWRK